MLLYAVVTKQLIKSIYISIYLSPILTEIINNKAVIIMNVLHSTRTNNFMAPFLLLNNFILLYLILLKLRAARGDVLTSPAVRTCLWRNVRKLHFVTAPFVEEQSVKAAESDGKSGEVWLRRVGEFGGDSL